MASDGQDIFHPDEPYPDADRLRELSVGDLTAGRPVVRLPPPDLRDKLRRLVWRVVYMTVYRFTPTPLFGLRCRILRVFGAAVAPGARPYPRASVWAPWNLDMATGSCLANDVDCYNVAPVRLGRGATVSQRAFLCTASHDIRSPAFDLVAARIDIGAEAWVAADAFIGPGVALAERSVVAARAVVTRSVAQEVVVGGNPARVIGLRGQVKRAKDACF